MSSRHHKRSHHQERHASPNAAQLVPYRSSLDVRIRQPTNPPPPPPPPPQPREYHDHHDHHHAHHHDHYHRHYNYVYRDEHQGHQYY
ncbi:unnamed protein product [Tenebrio molitor]|nr:unnamed protein product [Tenebrio molitor]